MSEGGRELGGHSEGEQVSASVSEVASKPTIVHINIC